MGCLNGKTNTPAQPQPQPEPEREKVQSYNLYRASLREICSILTTPQRCQRKSNHHPRSTVPTGFRYCSF